MCEGLILPLGSLLSTLSTGDKIDIGCAVVVLFNIGLGAQRGFATEVPLGAGWFCGILTAWYAYSPLLMFYKGLSFLQGQSETLFVCMAITIVLLAWIVASLAANGLRLLAIHIENTTSDHLLGTLFGMIRGFLLLLIIAGVMLTETCGKDSRDAFCKQSRTGRLFTPWANNVLKAIHKLKPDFEIHRRESPGDLLDQPPSHP